MQYRGWVKCFGGGANLAERNLGGSGGGKTLKNFEIFIPEIAANASNFRNHLMYMGNSSITIFLSIFP